LIDGYGNKCPRQQEKRPPLACGNFGGQEESEQIERFFFLARQAADATFIGVFSFI
jgi:hypothetical protein